MQVTLNAQGPAETRLLAAFLNDLADLQEINRVPPPVVDTPVAEDKPAPKKSRAKKEDSTPAPAAADSTVETSSVSEPEPEQTSAAGAEQAAESSPQETAADVTHDDLRTLFGRLTEAGKRDAAIKVIKSFGVNAIKDIPADKLAEVSAKLGEL